METLTAPVAQITDSKQTCKANCQRGIHKNSTHHWTDVGNAREKETVTRDVAGKWRVGDHTTVKPLI